MPTFESFFISWFFIFIGYNILFAIKIHNFKFIQRKSNGTNMKITEFDDYLLVEGLEDFNVKHTVECGQLFRYKVRDFGYTVYSLDQKADIYCQNDTVKIFTNNKKKHLYKSRCFLFINLYISKFFLVCFLLFL